MTGNLSEADDRAGPPNTAFGAPAPEGMPPPPVVYVPVRPDEAGNLSDIAMIRLADGRVALLAYTALDRLLTCCGMDQPWVLMFANDLADVRETKPFDIKLLDVEVPAEFRPMMRSSE